MEFDAEWERCKQYLIPALDESWTIEAVEQEIRANRAMFWPLEQSAGVTQIHEYPNGRVLRIWLAGGELEEVRKYLPAMDNYARWQGCVAVEVEGRPGWEKVLPGYKKKRIVLTKELNGKLIDSDGPTGD